MLQTKKAVSLGKKIFIYFSLFQFLCLFNTKVNAQTNPNFPNILLIIADDLGVDVSNGYHQNSLMATTPTLDSLRSVGVTFKQAWATPVCTSTRAAIMSGKYGVNTGVLNAPGDLDVMHTSIFAEMGTQTTNMYADAVIGKWHISQPPDYSHPTQHSVDFYSGVFSSSVSDYFSWERVENGMTSMETQYVTSQFTDKAITWVNAQTQPWFLWLAHVAPHSPVHVPPTGMYSLGPVGSNYRQYLAMIESLDFEIDRLLDNIPQAVKNNTVIIYIGDNGTPAGFLQNYPAGRGKGTLYQGGIHVPMIVSGPGVTRQGEEEDAMVHVTDIYATALEMAGVNLTNNTINNSISFKHLLDGTAGTLRDCNYSEITSTSVQGWTIRDNQYKLIRYDDGTEEFFDLIADSLETVNLLNGTLTSAETTAKQDLEMKAWQIRIAVSCQDGLQNGDETGIDCGGSTCPACTACTHDNTLNTNNIGCCDNPNIANFYNEIEYNDVRSISTNNYPNHDFCYNPNFIPSPIFYRFDMDATPSIATTITSILNPNNRPSRYFGVGLNGVLIAPAPAQPFIFENTMTGEYNWDWVFEATNNQGSGQGVVKLDCASAHTGPQGYHYHGNMFEYAENLQLGISTASTPPTDPIQIGWAADGFPILYRFGPDATGNLALLQPSYQLKSGNRPGNGISIPCGPYNGKYTNDYEYIVGLGDLDECNGVARDITLNTVCGPQIFNYFYVVTDNFPQISRCLVGTPDTSFDNGTSASSCQVDLISQNIVLSPNQSVTIGGNTYNAAGTYQDILTNVQSCDSVVISKITLSTGTPFSAKVFLEGTYQTGGTMTTNSNSLLPNNQPFNQAPWNYAGTETATTIPSDATDWVLVEVRDATNTATIIEQMACFVRNDGFLMDVNGATTLPFFNVTNGSNYTILIRSFNHLAIASANPIVFPQANPYDFTQSSNVMGGATQLFQSVDGNYAMIAGDINSDGVITVADFNYYQSEISLINNYFASDCNLDGTVSVTDFNLYKTNASVIGISLVRY